MKILFISIHSNTWGCKKFMVEIAIKQLRQLHFLSDSLRTIFYDMDSSDGGGTVYKLKDLLDDDQYKIAAETALKINELIIDLDAENTKFKNDTVDYDKVFEELFNRLSDLQTHYHILSKNALKNNKLSESSCYDDFYHELLALEEYLSEDLLQ